MPNRTSLFVVAAALALFATGARAESKKVVLRTVNCASYEGDWSDENKKKQWDENGKTVCVIDDEGDAACTVTTSTDDAFKFKGGSVHNQPKATVIEAYDKEGNMTLQVVCKNRDLTGCIGIRVFNPDKKMGMQCVIGGDE